GHLSRSADADAAPVSAGQSRPRVDSARPEKVVRSSVHSDRTIWHVSSRASDRSRVLPKGIPNMVLVVRPGSAQPELQATTGEVVNRYAILARTPGVDTCCR